MKPTSSATFIAWRFYLVLTFIGLAASGLMWRVFDLSILDQPFLRKQGDERALRLSNTPAFRGMIVDRNGFPLAISTSVFSIWINPKEFHADSSSLIELSETLQLKPKEINAIATHYQKLKREFVYLKRGLSPELANQIKSLSIPGVYLQEEYRRFYPEGETMAHLIGFTNIDDHGQEGLELAYNEWLSGELGKKWVMKDRLGQVIAEVQTMQAEKPGHDLILSIDRRIQYLAYRELLAGVIQNHADSGTAIVLNSKTGEVLAMVNYPSFNPNNRPVKMSEAFRNRAVTDIFEPGSTIKAFTVASAFETGKLKPDSVIDTSPGWMRVGRNVVEDEKNNGLLSVGQILQISSNMGAAKIVLSLPPDELWSLLNRVGFGEPTGIHFPGEQNGSLIHHNPWGSFTLATLSFGYGITGTALQLARAYSVLANHGVKYPISLLRLDKAPLGQQVLSPKVANQMLELLQSVLQKGGTGELARVPGYLIAGKTGTARRVGEHGYLKHRYTASFVGIAPLTDPSLVVAVVIHDPKGKQFLGGMVAGPVFSNIMGGTLRILDIPPDDVQNPMRNITN